MSAPWPKDENGETVAEKLLRLSREGKIKKAMQLFSEVHGGVAIVRKAPGILKQVPLYSRGEQVFIKEAGGFIRICDRFGSDPYLTIHPSYKVLELDGAGIICEANKAPRFNIR